MDHQDSSSASSTTAKDVQEQKPPSGRRFFSARKLHELEKLEASLEKALSSIYSEIDRLDVEWLQLCNLAVPQTTDSKTDLILNRNKEVEATKIIDNAEEINATSINLNLNLPLGIKQDEEFESEDEI